MRGKLVTGISVRSWQSGCTGTFSAFVKVSPGPSPQMNEGPAGSPLASSGVTRIVNSSETREVALQVLPEDRRSASGLPERSS